MQRSTYLLTCAAPAVLWLLGCNMEQEQARKALKSPRAAMRADAVKVLARTGGPEVAAELVPLIKDPSARVRRNVVAALGALGPDKYLGQLAGRLRDPDLEVRLAAVRVLGDCKHARATKLLLPMLADPGLVIRRAASRALQRQGLALRAQTERTATLELQRQLTRLHLEDGQLRASAVREIGLAGRSSSLPVLIRLLSDNSPLVVAEAATAVGRLGGKQAQASLVKLSHSKRGLDRVAAAGGLGHLGHAPSLTRLTGDAVPAVRLAALAALTGMVHKGAGSVLDPGSICARLEDQQPEVAQQAARLVQAAEMPCSGQLAVLLASAKAVRAPGPRAARLLALMAPIRRPAVTTALLALARMLHQAHGQEAAPWIQPDQWTKIAAEPAPALAAPPPKAAQRRGLRKLLASFPHRPNRGKLEHPLMPPRVSLDQVLAGIRAMTARKQGLFWLARVAGEGNTAARVAALEVLSSFGPGSVKGTANLVSRTISRALVSKLPAIRQAAARACHLLGTEAASRAILMLEDPDFEMRAAGARCLGKLRHAAAVKLMLKYLARERQLALIEALARIGDHQATAPIAAMLQQDHHSGRWHERVVVVKALGTLGDPSAAASLQRELSHPHWKVRLAAARALSRAGRRSSLEALEVCRADYYSSVRESCGRSQQIIRRGRP